MTTPVNEIYLVQSGWYDEYYIHRLSVFTTLEKAEEEVHKRTNIEMKRAFEKLKKDKIAKDCIRVSALNDRGMFHIRYHISDHAVDVRPSYMSEEQAYEYTQFWNSITEETQFKDIADVYRPLFLQSPEGIDYHIMTVPRPLM